MAQLAHAKSGSTTLTGIGNPASHRQRGQKLRRIAKPSPQRHRKMTSQGSAHGRFQRAIHRRNVENAEMAAREMGGLSLADALSLCEYSRTPTRPATNEPRCAGSSRFIDERLPPLTEVARAASALVELRYGNRNVGIEALKGLLRHG